jgi:hypothetical protein
MGRLDRTPSQTPDSVVAGLKDNTRAARRRADALAERPSRVVLDASGDPKLGVEPFCLESRRGLKPRQSGEHAGLVRVRKPSGEKAFVPPFTPKPVEVYAEGSHMVASEGRALRVLDSITAGNVEDEVPVTVSVGKASSTIADALKSPQFEPDALTFFRERSLEAAGAEVLRADGVTITDDSSSDEQDDEEALQADGDSDGDDSSLEELADQELLEEEEAFYDYGATARDHRDN